MNNYEQDIIANHGNKIIHIPRNSKLLPVKHISYSDRHNILNYKALWFKARYTILQTWDKGHETILTF